MKNQKGEKRLCTIEEILVSPIYKFVPNFVESPTRTSIQFEDKHFEDNTGKCINHNCDPNAKVINCKRDILSSIMSIFQNNITELAWVHDLNNIFKYFNNYFEIIKNYNSIISINKH